MASSRGVEKLLLNIRADLKDLKNLQLELETVRKKGKEVETGISEGIKNALGTLGASFTTLKIKGVFDGAVADANRLEKTMLGLQATAKLTGNSFAQIKSAVNNLSKDGVLSIDQASQSMKVLLAQGVAADKAFQLVDAAKKVGAFNNIVGDTGQAVQDFIKFLQTGSAELAENLDPSLVKVIKSLGGYEAVANNAAAKQKLINAVIEKGSALTGDYEKFLQSGSQAAVTFDKSQERLSQTFGQKLAPAYATMRSLGAKFLDSITSIISGLSSFTVQVISFSVLGVAAFASLGGAAVTFGFVTKAAFLSILGPVAAIVGALAGIVAVAYELSNVKTTKEIADEYRKQKEEVNGLASSIENLSKIRERTVSQERELRDSLEQLREKLKAAGIDYDALAAKTKNYTDFAKAATSELRTKKAADIAEQVKSTEDNLKIYEEAVRISEQYYARQGLSISQNLPLVNAEGVNRGIGTYGNTRDAIEKLRARRDSQVLDQAAVLTEEDNNKAAASAVSGPAKPEARYIKTRDEIKAAADAMAASQSRYLAKQSSLAPLRDSVQKEYDKAVKKFGEEDRRTLRVQFRLEKVKDAIDEAQAQFNEAGLKFTLDTENLQSQLNQQIAEYVEEKYEAEAEALKQQQNQQIANVYELLNAKKISEEQAEEKLAKIRMANAKKEMDLRAKSLNETLTGADNIVKSLGAIKQAQNAGGAISGVGGLFGGIGGMQGAFKEGGLFGENSTLAGLTGAVGTVAPFVAIGGSIVSGISSLFSKSQEELQKEAEETERRHQEAMKIMQLQEDHARNLLALAEAEAKTPFENLQRNLRLIDIQAQRSELSGTSKDVVEKQRIDARQAAFQQILSEQGGKIAEGQLFGDTQATPESLVDFLNKRAEQAKAIAQFNELIQSTAEPAMSFGRMEAILGVAKSYKGKIPDALYTTGIAGLERVYRYLHPQSELDRADTRQFNESASQFSTRQSTVFQSVLNALASARSGAESLVSEVAIDTRRADSIVGVLQDSLQNQQAIKDFAGQTAANTSKLAQLDDRKVSYLDLGEKRVISRGFNVSVDRLKLPDSVASTVLASSASPSVPSDTLAAFRKMIELAEESNDYLAMIAANTDSKASTNTDDFETRLVAKLLELKGRRVAA